jgi:hypothetical protein
MLEDHRLVTDFEMIVQSAVDKVNEKPGSSITLNFVHKVRFSADLLSEEQLRDAAPKAVDWQSVVVPDHLYFSHGKFIGENGIEHIAAELRRKPDSNRALASLISQEHILGSKDDPLPSLLVVQSSIVDKTLYLTTMFRALEVSTFFRINLEEIRLIAAAIHKECPDFTQVAVCVFAFRAYVKEGLNTLERCEIDRLSEGTIIKRLEKKPHELASLLREKAKHTTMASSASMRLIAGILGSSEKSSDIRGEFQTALMRRLVDVAIKELDRYAEVRFQSSHDSMTIKQSARAITALEEVAKEFERYG